MTLTLLLAAVSVNVVFAATGTIIAPNQYAWDDNGGYVNWLASGGNVTVTDTALTGYIWSAGFGWINLSPTLGGVTNASGTLAGFAWGENTGWIDFTGVTIDQYGVFHGHTVPQSTFGTMTFDCTYCKVVTSWLAPYVPPPPPTSSGGNGPPPSGPFAYGYVTSQSTSTELENITIIAATTSVPASLIPTSPPPHSKPTTKPPIAYHPTHPQVPQTTEPQTITTPTSSVPVTAYPPTTPISNTYQPSTQPVPAVPATPLPPACSFFTCWLQTVWQFFHSFF